MSYWPPAMTRLSAHTWVKFLSNLKIYLSPLTSCASSLEGKPRIEWAHWTHLDLIIALAETVLQVSSKPRLIETIGADVLPRHWQAKSVGLQFDVKF